MYQRMGNLGNVPKKNLGFFPQADISLFSVHLLEIAASTSSTKKKKEGEKSNHSENSKSAK